jgi:hypothetical protein
LACVAAGWKCPGFTKRWKFVHENQQLLTQYKNKRYVFEELDYACPSSSVEFQNRQPQDLASYNDYGLINFRINILHHLSSENDLNASVLKHVLTDPQSRVVFPLESLGNFFKFIPSRLGTNLALDAAVSCLCAIYNETRTKNTPNSAVSVKQYVRSLSALQTCLNDPALSSESETICASIILQICEVSCKGSLAYHWPGAILKLIFILAVDHYRHREVESTFKRV